jgi:YhcN/YlaJ family sporulation lipoprotein
LLSINIRRFFMKRLIAPALLAASIFAFSGCSASVGNIGGTDALARFEKGTTRTYKRNKIFDPPILDSDMLESDEAPKSEEPDERKIRASKIAKEAASLEGVIAASAVVNGNTALIGIQVSAGLSGQEYISLKRRIIEKAKTADPALNEVNVTRDRDIFNRMRDLDESGVSWDGMLTSDNFRCSYDGR